MSPNRHGGSNSMFTNKIRNSHRRNMFSTNQASPQFQSILERDSSTESLSQHGYDNSHFHTISTTEGAQLHKTIQLYNKFNATVSNGFKKVDND